MVQYRALGWVQLATATLTIQVSPKYSQLQLSLGYRSIEHRRNDVRL